MSENISPAVKENQADLSEPLSDAIAFEKIVYVEYAFLIVAFVATLAALSVAPNQSTQTYSLWISVASLLILALMAPLKPLRWNTQGRLIACLGECLLLSVSLWLGVTRLNQPLFMIVIAKAAALLPTRSVAVLVAIAGISQFGCEFFKLRLAHTEAETAILSAILLTVGPLLLLIACALTVLSLKRERHSRFESERLAAEVEELAKQLERSRITREIHDVIGHTLTTIKIQLEVASRYASIDEGEARASIERAKNLASSSLEEIREVLRSSHGDKIQLAEALTKVADQLNETGAFRVDVQIDPGELPPRVAQDVYRMVQECLTNVARHAGADHAKASIRLNAEEKRLYVQVSDNGTGFTEQDRKGLGLSGIRERVDRLGGELEIGNGEDGGAYVKATIPLS